MRKTLLLGLIVAGLLAAMAATRWLTLPPAPRTRAALNQFDVFRAKARLARVLGVQAPHPADTPANDRVRERLLGELRGMGLQPRVDDRFACNNLHKQSGISCARVRNVLVTLGDRPGAKHLMINSHYDSVPVGPGASDAGLGVAAMMEATYLLKDRKLARPVTFLFNEGEELGLLGARAFLDGDPLRDRVDALINLEARGTTGPVNMFETSVPNAAPMKLFAGSVRHPVASSLAVSAYRLIPNYTDVNSFAESKRWLTLNFAPIGNETRYHSPGDDLAGQDLATLQHMGDQLVETATALSATAGLPAADGEWLFMTMPPFGLITLPVWVGLVLGCAIGLVLLIEVHRRRAWLALVLLAASLICGTALAYAGLGLVGTLRAGQFWRAHPGWSELAIYAGVVTAGLIAVRTAQRVSLRQWRIAFWLLALLIGAVMTWFAGGALIYFVVAPAFFVAGLVAALRWPALETVLAVLAATAFYLSLGSMLGLVQDLANGGPLWLFAPFGALLLLPSLIETKPLVDGVARRPLILGALVLAALAWLPAALAPAYSSDRQQQWTLQYVLEQGRPPVWSIVNDRQPLSTEFNRFGAWRQGILPLGKRLRWIAEAPAQPGFVLPRLEPVGDIQTKVGRSLLFRLRTNDADSVSLGVDGQGALIGGGFNGRAVLLKPETKAPYSVSCSGRSCDGAILQLDVGKAPVAVQLTATHWRLPPAAIPLQHARPAFARPQYVPDATILVTRLKI